MTHDDDMMTPVKKLSRLAPGAASVDRDGDDDGDGDEDPLMEVTPLNTDRAHEQSSSLEFTDGLQQTTVTAAAVPDTWSQDFDREAIEAMEASSSTSLSQQVEQTQQEDAVVSEVLPYGRSAQWMLQKRHMRGAKIAGNTDDGGHPILVFAGYSQTSHSDTLPCPQNAGYLLRLHPQVQRRPLQL